MTPSVSGRCSTAELTALGFARRPPVFQSVTLEVGKLSRKKRRGKRFRIRAFSACESVRKGGPDLLRHHARCGRAFPLCDGGVLFPAPLYESVVFAVARPRAGGDIPEIDKFPVGHIDALDAEVVADGRGNVEASPLVQAVEKPPV